MCRLPDVDVSEESVIRTNKELVVGGDNDWTARGTNARIDNRDVYRPAWKRLVRREQRERTGLDILRRDLVRDVYDNDVWIDGKNRAFNSSDEIIRRPEIRKQSNNGEIGRRPALSP